MASAQPDTMTSLHYMGLNYPPPTKANQNLQKFLRGVLVYASVKDEVERAQHGPGQPANHGRPNPISQRLDVIA